MLLDILSGSTGSGLNSYEYKTDNLPSGSYFIKLKYGDKVETLPIMVVK